MTIQTTFVGGINPFRPFTRSITYIDTRDKIDGTEPSPRTELVPKPRKLSPAAIKLLDVLRLYPRGASRRQLSAALGVDYSTIRIMLNRLDDRDLTYSVDCNKLQGAPLIDPHRLWYYTGKPY